MYKLKTLIKSALTLLFRISAFIFKEIFFFMPFYIIILVAMQFYSISLEKKLSPEQYKIIFAAIGITATLSGL